MIIRSPAISDQKRKLTTRRSRQHESQATEVPSKAAPQSVAVPIPVQVEDPVAKDAGVDLQGVIEQTRMAVLSQFKQEADSARELARQRGLREGRLEGAQEAKQSLTDEVARVRAIGDSLTQAISAGIGGLEDMAVAIAFEAVCKILGSAAPSREGVQALVEQAAAQALNSEGLVVRLHADDFALLDREAQLGKSLPSGKSVSWVADNSVELGGCIIETSGGNLDARLETQLQRLRFALLAARQNATDH